MYDFRAHVWRDALPDEFVIRELIDLPDVAALERIYGPLRWVPDPLPPEKRAVLSARIEREGGELVSQEERRFAELRVAARFWLALAIGDEEAAINAPTTEGFEPFVDVEYGLMDVVGTINDELSGAFSLRLLVDGVHEPGEEHPVADVLQVAALQLARLFAEGRQALRCANETCGRVFVRQRSTRRKTTNQGGYAGTAHAAGVRYCSAECGKAQQARERRRRERVAKGAEA